MSTLSSPEEVRYSNPKSGNKFKNLNLNSSHSFNSNYNSTSKNLNVLSPRINKFNRTGGDNEYYYDSIEKRKKKYYDPWKNQDEPKYFKNFDFEDAEKNERKKIKGTESESGSTLSLHILFYENSIEVKYGDKNGETKQFKSEKDIKSLKTFKNFIFPEIPRQQRDNTSKPEVMQFKASQKLLNPNDPQYFQPLSLFPQHLRQPNPSAIRFFQQAGQHQRFPRPRQIQIARPQTFNSVIKPEKFAPLRPSLDKSFALKKEEPKKIAQKHTVKTKQEDATFVRKKNAKISNSDKSGKIKNTKRKEEWDNPEVCDLIDNFILKNQPTKKSTLIASLQPYFGKVGRTTVIHHINVREKELKGTKKILKNAKITNFIKKNAPKVDVNKQSFIEKSAVEVAVECAPPKSDNLNDPCALLNQQIENIQKMLDQPQTAEHSTALENLLKRLIEAKEEYVKNKKIPLIEQEYNVDLSFDSPEAPFVKFKVPRGKKKITNYYFGYNEKLTKNLLIIYEDKNNVREFSLEKTHNGTRYYTCCRCRSNHDHHLKHNFSEPAKQCRAIVLPNGEVYVDVYHAKSCGAIPKVMSDSWQARRIASIQAANGAKTKIAFDTGFKNALEKDAFAIYGNYTSRLNNLSRWRGKYIPDCSKGNVKQYHENLFNLKRRWLLEDANDVVIFATDKQLLAMANATVVAVDSTFSITPGGFKQVFFMHSLIESNEGEHWVVTAMALMVNKDEASYDIIFNSIKKRWGELGVKPTFERVHADYEEAQSNALKTAFGEDKINGCLFHFDQCLLRYIGERGLYPYYNQKKTGKDTPESHRRIRTWIRSLMALPLLPKYDCQELAKILCRPPPKPENVSENEWPTVALQEVADYVNNEWVSRKDHMWNFNNLRRVRNTNRCEGFHSALGKMLDKKPKLKLFLKDMQLLCTEIEAEIEGIQQNRQKAYRSKKYAWLDERLKFYEDLFQKDISEAKTTTEKNFVRFRHCRRVSYLLHEIRNKSCNTVKSEKKHKPETLKVWKTDLNYIFDKDEDYGSWIEWMEKEEDLMISRGELEDDLDDIVEESFSFEMDEKDFNDADLSVLLASPPLNPAKNNSETMPHIFPGNNSKLKNISGYGIPLFNKQISPHRIEFLKPGEVKSPTSVKEINIDTTVAPKRKPETSVKNVKDVKPAITFLPKKFTNNKDDDCQVTYEKLQRPAAVSEKRIIRRRIIRNIQIQGPDGNLLAAKHYNCIMPPSTNLTQSDLFIPPALEQIQHYLLLLDLPPELAYNSPLLNSMVVEPEGKSMVTFYTTGDGNCGYRSLSTLLTGVEDYHWHIRLKIYEYISYNGENIYGIRSAELAREYYVKYQHLLNVPPQPVNQDLYAGNDDFYALADMLECNIYTYTPDPLPSYPNVNSHFKDNIKINGAPTLFLMYLNNNHYEPIISFQ